MTGRKIDYRLQCSHLCNTMDCLEEELATKDRLIKDMADILDKIKKGKWVMYKDEAEKLVKKARGGDKQ